MTAVSGPVLRMNAADANCFARGCKPQRVATGNATGEDRTRDDGAMAREREDAIDREPEQTVVAPCLPMDGRFAQCCIKGGDTGIGGHVRAGFKDARAGQWGSFEQGLDLRTDLGVPRLVDAIDLRHRHRAGGDAEQLQDCQMFARLRHHAVVGRDDEQGEVDAAGTGRHRVNKTFMPGDIDDAEHIPIGERRVGISEFDRDAACLLFLESIGVDAGQCAHQRGLAVIDMACGSDDHRGRPKGTVSQVDEVDYCRIAPSCEVLVGMATRASNLKPQRCQLCSEHCLVCRFETTQVEPQRVVGEAADHGARQRAQGFLEA